MCGAPEGRGRVMARRKKKGISQGRPYDNPAYESLSKECDACTGKGGYERGPDGLLYYRPCPVCGRVDEQLMETISHWT